MRILLLNQYFPPDTSATAVILGDLIKEFASRGHNVSVLCGRPSYDPGPVVPVLVVGQGTIRVVRVPSSSFDRSSTLGRFMNYVTFLILAVFRGLLMKRPDVVVAATDPPLAIWPALAAAKGRPVVYSLRDLHPDAAIAAGMISPGVFTQSWDRIHSMGMRRATMTVCLGDRMAELVLAKGVQPERVTVIEDGAWLPRSEPDPAIVAQIRGDAPFVAMYAGNLGGAFPWDVLCEANGLLDGAEIILVGEGAQASGIRGKIRIEPFRPLDELSSVMAAGDLQLVPLRKEMSGQVVPSKLFTVLAHGRPVLGVVGPDSEVARVIEEWECGVVVDPTSPRRLAEAIDRLKDRPDLVAAMAERAKVAGERFERGRLLKEFATLTESLAAGSLVSGRG